MNEINNLNAYLKELSDKILSQTLEEADLEKYFEILCNYCNNSEEIKENCQNWFRKFQINIENNSFFFEIIPKVVGTKEKEDAEIYFNAGKGKIDDPDVIIEMPLATALNLFSGLLEADIAYLRNELVVIGPLIDAIKFKNILELFYEYLIDFVEY
ncbi:MAG: hypothetical protein ACTSRZ_01940 [Promethearchaeota archaeon]